MPRNGRKKQRQRKTYSFPILKGRKIIICMKELGIVITKADLNAPREERYKYIYSAILETLLKISLNNNNQHNQKNKNKLYEFEFPELHETSVTQIRIIRTLIRFMRRTGVKDFCISDLISPEKSRTIRNLSAIINFAKFRNQKWQLFVEIRESEKSVCTEFKKLQLLNKNLGNEFIRLEETKAIQEPEVFQLTNEISEIAQSINQHMKNANDTKIQIHQIKGAIAQTKYDISQNTMILNANLDEIRNLESKIVRNPEKLQKTLLNMKMNVNKRKIEISRKLLTIEALERKLNTLVALNKNITKVHRTMTDISGHQREYAAIKEQYKSVNAKKKQLSKSIGRITKEENNIKVSLNNAKTNLKTTERNNYQTKNEIKKKLRILSEKQSDIETVNEKYQNKIKSLRNEIKGVVADMGRKQTHQETKQQLIQDKYAQLQIAIDEYKSKMDSKMKIWMTEMENHQQSRYSE